MENKQLREVIRQITYYPKIRSEMFKNLTANEKVRVLLGLGIGTRKEVFSRLSVEEQVEVVEHLDPNDATDMLQLIDVHKREHILKAVQSEIKEEISLLLAFDPDSAAGLMSLDYVQIDGGDTIRDAIEKVRVHEKRTGRIPTVLVMDKNVLAGYLPVYQLALSATKDKVKTHTKHINVIAHTAGSKEAQELIQQSPHEVIAVVKDEKVLGVIYSDDVLNMLRLQTGKGLYRFAGLSEEESVFDNAHRKFLFRYKWLIINLATAFLAAFTVSFFEETIARNVLLAVYMPIVAGMGGNAGTQTLAVMVRGLASQRLPLGRIISTLRSEIVAGMLNGIVNGLIIFAIVSFFNKDIMVATVLAIAMVVNLVIAATFGTLVPVLMQKLGKDPASSATIFITTATDVFGFLAFLGLATVLLR